MKPGLKKKPLKVVKDWDALAEERAIAESEEVEPYVACFDCFVKYPAGTTFCPRCTNVIG